VKVLFVNTHHPKCGVHQFGSRFFKLLASVPTVERCNYTTVDENGGFNNREPYDIVIANVHHPIQNALSHRPNLSFAKHKLALVYEHAPEGYDGYILSAPDNHLQTSLPVYLIGRPLVCDSPPPSTLGLPEETLVVGSGGFVHEWAVLVARRIAGCYPHIHLRLHLPQGKFAVNDEVERTVARCRAALGGWNQVSVETGFMSDDWLLNFFRQNHINCFIRPLEAGPGISSILDHAVSVNRPIAINRCPMFRDLYESTPEVLVENHGIMDIVRAGPSVLDEFRFSNRTEILVQQLQSILEQQVNKP